MVWRRIFKPAGQIVDPSFALNIPNILNGAILSMRTNCIARSVGAGSNFDVRVNNNSLQQINIPPVGTGHTTGLPRRPLRLHQQVQCRMILLSVIRTTRVALMRRAAQLV
jgi:hypothetical protein